MIVIPEAAILQAVQLNIVGGKIPPKLVREVLPASIYSLKDINSIIEFFNKNEVKIRTHYTQADETPLAIYVSEGTVSLYDSTIGGEGEWSDTTLNPEFVGGSDTPAEKFETALFHKGVRIICTSTNHDVLSALTAIVQYIIMAQRRSLEALGMSNMRLESPEIDYILKFFPENLFKRTTLLTFDVADLFKVGDYGIIKRITVDGVNGINLIHEVITNG